MDRTTIVILLASILLFSGCAARPSAAFDPVRLSAPIPLEPEHPLARAAEPEDFLAATFSTATIVPLLPSFIATQPVNPVLASLPDGRLLAGTPSCDVPEPLGADFANQTDRDGCQQRVLYLSDAAGASWERLNKDPRGRLDRRIERPYGHLDIAADGNGTLYAAMGDVGYNDLFLYRSRDHGTTWNATLNAVEPRATRDGGPVVRDGRVVAAGLGRVLAAWRGCEQVNTTCWIGLKVSFREGHSWSPAIRFGEHVRALGPFVAGPTGYDVHVAYWEGNADDAHARLHVLSSPNWGITWHDEALDVTLQWDALSQQRGARYPIPVIAPLGGGGFALAWTQTVPAGAVATVSHEVHFAVKNPGSGWSAPTQVPGTGPSRFPWIVAGAGDRFAITYLRGALPSDALVQRWDLIALLLDGNAGGIRTLETVIETGVHTGAFCEGTQECLAGNPRLYLDFLESAARSDGTLAVTYPVTSGPSVDWRVAVQVAGSGLFVPTSS
jgi:hypothetical protein